MPSLRGEVVGVHPSFPSGSAVQARECNGPVPIDEPDFEYSEEDENTVEDWIRGALGTSWHSLGTCAMKKREDGGVVDSRLNVYGVEGLKVADLSICPENVHPSFPSGSAVQARECNGPVPIDEPDFEYSEEDENTVEDWIRGAVGTSWHSKREDGGVVDSRLNVYGVEGLKVADLSICSENVAANTYSTAILIDEKAATIIAEDLGIPLD